MAFLNPQTIVGQLFGPSSPAMILPLSFSILIGIANLALAKPLLRRFDDFTEKHAWTEIPRGWVYEAPAPRDHEFDLRIALKQDKIDDLIANLLEVSNPTHARHVTSG